MRITRSRIFTGLMIVGILVAARYFLGSSHLRASDPEWECRPDGDAWRCAVTVFVENRSREARTARLSIRGMGLKTGARSQHLDILGERVIPLALRPQVRVRIREDISMRKKPGMIRVHLWE